MQLSSIIASITFLLLLIACSNPPCENRNQVFDNYSFEKKQYKDELRKQIQLIGAEKLSYWVDSYFEKDSLTYLTVNFNGEGICAKGVLLVTDWSKIKDIQRTKGMGYQGAELVGLKFDMPNNESSDDFVYRDVDYVRD